VALAYLTVLSAAASIWWPVALLSAAGLAAAVTVLNRDFYRYFMTHSGPWFTIRVLPMHWLYFGYCGFSAFCGTLLHYLTRARNASPALPQKIGPNLHAR
jgi:hypothetical protein